MVILLLAVFGDVSCVAGGCRLLGNVNTYDPYKVQESMRPAQSQYKSLTIDFRFENLGLVLKTNGMSVLNGVTGEIKCVLPRILMCHGLRGWLVTYLWRGGPPSCAGTAESLQSWALAVQARAPS